MRTGFAIGAMAVLAATAPAFSAVVGKFEAGSWNGLAYTDDATGRFSHCTVYSSGAGDAALYISYEMSGDWFLSITDPSWSLTKGDDYPIRIALRDAKPIDDEILALAPRQIGLSIDEHFVEELRDAKTIAIVFQGEDLAFDLADAGVALDAAQSCVRSQAATEAAAKDASGKPPGDDGTASGGGNPASAYQGGGLPRLGSDVIEEFVAPGWEAAALAEDGVFTHCAIRAEYQNGATLGFGVTVDDLFVMALRQADWSLATGERLPVEYTLDDATPLDAATEGVAVDPGLIVVELGARNVAAAAFRDAARLSVEAGGTTLSFDISDMDDGLSAIDTCLDRHRGDAGR